ncbi:MAG: cytochrome b [Alphaproteobacteria bacterium]|nr:cytochrome b [Alphaproteobacteria bacterium]NDC55779.1 cytochrome b [Alphaproteobacteria bacterium]NDG04951.1 cytochrome b [Alphaproteobacteria bacterium]
MASQARYHTVSIILHWLMAVLIIGMWLLGKAMADDDWGALLGVVAEDKGSLYALHKATGMLLLCLTVVRMAWRMTHKPPALPAALPKHIAMAAAAVHALMYGLMLGLPLTGWIMSSANPTRPPISQYGLFDWPRLPVENFVADAAGAGRLMNQSHEFLSTLLALLLALHVGAVVYHTVIRRDGMLSRMVPARR